jgi:polyhydroxyalkanoate synthesis repressor PhaR
LPLIRRYTNRKLYDTEGKRYVSLDDIAGLVRAREEVQVLDHLTGEDLTVSVLSSILQREGKKASLPESLLRALIQRGNEAWQSLAETEAFDDLVSRGEIVWEDVLRHKKALDKAIARRLLEVLERHNAPTQEDLSRLERQVEDLTQKVDSLIMDSDG